MNSADLIPMRRCHRKFEPHDGRRIWNWSASFSWTIGGGLASIGIPNRPPSAVLLQDLPWSINS